MVERNKVLSPQAINAIQNKVRSRNPFSGRGGIARLFELDRNGRRAVKKAVCALREGNLAAAHKLFTVAAQHASHGGFKSDLYETAGDISLRMACAAEDPKGRKTSLMSAALQYIRASVAAGSPEKRAKLFEKVGDAAAEAGQNAHAVISYGRAIEEFTKAGDTVGEFWVREKKAACDLRIDKPKGNDAGVDYFEAAAGQEKNDSSRASCSSS